MNQIIVLLGYLFFFTSLFASEKDTTASKPKATIFSSSISALLGGGNKNYHDDSFYSVALRYESKSEYVRFSFEIENLINNETGYESCFGEPEFYKKTYNTTYINTQFGFGYKYIGFDLGISRVNQTRGWCENILEFGYAFSGRFNFGLLDRYYVSVGNSDNFRVTLHYEIFEMGITYLFDQGLSSIRFESMISRGHWGFGLIIKKNIFEKFIAIGELYSFDEIQITKSERTTEVYNIRMGIGYLFGGL